MELKREKKNYNFNLKFKKRLVFRKLVYNKNVAVLIEHFLIRCIKDEARRSYSERERERERARETEEKDIFYEDTFLKIVMFRTNGVIVELRFIGRCFWPY